MAKMTKAARRRAALKGWRNRTKRNPSKRKKSASKRISSALKKWLKKPNPSRRKGKSVRLKNFTGTISKKGGQIVVRGKGR
jgi:hypothetical protein